jgi:CheY-like chemotaxis protein
MVRILVIDDDGDILEILGEMLTDAGYEVVEASSGGEGIKLYRQNPFDLVITDLVMPEKDGLEVVMELHKDFPDLKIITLSGNAYGRSSLETSKALGAARTLGKPFSEAQLLETVRGVLESN